MKKFFEIFKWEFLAVFKDPATLLLLFGAALLYSFLYGYLYGPEVVKNMPIGVVDNDKTSLSRELIRAYDASEAVAVVCQPSDMLEAQNMLLRREISGIVTIPDGFEANALSGVQSHLSIYADGSYFLHYSALVKSSSAISMEFGRRVQKNILVAKGIPYQRAEVISKPVDYTVETLYNPSSGYATALMPAVMMIIIQQSLLIIIGMIIATQTEFKLWKRLNDYSTSTILFAKVLAYFVVTLPQVIYMFAIVYKLFDYPIRENTLDLILFFVPYLLSVIFLGISLGGIFHRREASMLYLAPLSVCFLLWSGVSWPQESMPTWFYSIGTVLPSTLGIKGIVALRTCGSSLADISRYYLMLWLLTAVFSVTAFYSIRNARRRAFL